MASTHANLADKSMTGARKAGGPVNNGVHSSRKASEPHSKGALLCTSCYWSSWLHSLLPTNKPQCILRGGSRRRQQLEEMEAWYLGTYYELPHVPLLQGLCPACNW